MVKFAVEFWWKMLLTIFPGKRSSKISFQTSPEVRHQFCRKLRQLHSGNRWCLCRGAARFAILQACYRAPKNGKNPENTKKIRGKYIPDPPTFAFSFFVCQKRREVFEQRKKRKKENLKKNKVFKGWPSQKNTKLPTSGWPPKMPSRKKKRWRPPPPPPKKKKKNTHTHTHKIPQFPLEKKTEKSTLWTNTGQD